MFDTLRIKSTLPLALRISEPHPDADHPGNSPALKQAVIYPGVNEGIDAGLFRAWAKASGADFVASEEDVKAGNTEGKLYEMSEDEPETEYGFEPALKRAIDATGSAAAKGSTQTAPGPVKADDMKTGSADPAGAPVLTAASPLKLPATADTGQGKPFPSFSPSPSAAAK